MANRKASLGTYCALAGVLVLVKVLFTIRPITYPIPGQDLAFAWTMIGGISLVGLVGVLLMPRAGIAGAWEPSVSNWQRFGIPTVAGLVYGVVTVLGDLPHPHVKINVPLPWSVPYYAYGAVLLEIMLRVFAVPAIICLVSWGSLRR